VAQHLEALRWLAKSCDRNRSLNMGWTPTQAATFREGRDLSSERALKLEAQLRAEGWDMGKIEEIIWSKAHPWASLLHRGISRVFGRGWGGR
jgi:hypothetical protein